jgi:putative transposase
MTNTRRFHLPDVPQHVVQRGNNGQPCFVDDDDRAEYLLRLAAGSAKFGVAIHAYVLMTNHVHLLATPREADGMARLMQAVGSGYVRSFNAKRSRTGTLWDGRYFSSPIGGDAYLWNCYRYIELNPVRAGIVAEPGGYRWSSHARNAYGRTDPVVAPHPNYVALASESGDRLASYRSMFDGGLTQDTLAALRQSLWTERAFGGEEFMIAVESAADRSPRCRPRGRPRGATAQLFGN